MAGPVRTREDSRPAGPKDSAPSPALVVVQRGGAPALETVVVADGPLTIGREGCDLTVEDDLVSRAHAEVDYDGEVWTIRDLGSRNGTFVDGSRVENISMSSPQVVRVGHTVCVPVSNAGPLVGGVVERRGDMIVGPTLGAAIVAVERAAKISSTLLITGGSGTGKEHAARLFHAAGPRPKGPFVAVNCAAIPQGVAERLLFGAKRGAYSGATEDADGYVQSATGGTLFLDELGELDAAVQAKLLRVLESREVLQLGASKPRKVDVRVCSATHASLREQVSAKRFREDLYFRIARPEVRLPALVERVEDISYLITAALLGVDASLSAHAELVEACLLRAWPGNVRELLMEVRSAGHAALAADRAEVLPEDLADTAGIGFDDVPEDDAGEPDRARLEAALADNAGNVSAAARSLGVHRTQLRRWIQRLGIDPKAGR
jgi:transcriptional regulator with GAF, ATPase, and Fis domain